MWQISLVEAMEVQKMRGQAMIHVAKAGRLDVVSQQGLGPLGYLGMFWVETYGIFMASYIYIYNIIYIYIYTV